jgi:hypothetical protein
MKLLPQEVKRLKANAILVKQVSPDTKLEITKRNLGDWNKDVLATLHRKKRIQNMLLVLVETGEEE